MLPKAVEVFLVTFNEFRVVYHNKVFLIHADGLTRPVEASSDKDLAVNEYVLVVHVRSEVVVGCARNSKKPESVNFRPVKFAAFIIADYSDLNAFTVRMHDGVAEPVIGEGKNTNVHGLFCASQDVGEFFFVLLAWEKH